MNEDKEFFYTVVEENYKNLYIQIVKEGKQNSKNTAALIMMMKNKLFILQENILDNLVTSVSQALYLPLTHEQHLNLETSDFFFEQLHELLIDLEEAIEITKNNPTPSNFHYWNQQFNNTVDYGNDIANFCNCIGQAVYHSSLVLENQFQKTKSIQKHYQKKTPSNQS